MLWENFAEQTKFSERLRTVKDSANAKMHLCCSKVQLQQTQYFSYLRLQTRSKLVLNALDPVLLTTAKR